MRLAAILFTAGALGLVSCSWRRSAQSNHQSKWDIIHHEYHGPPAPLADDGRVIDTPEVAKARSNHLAIHAEVVADHVKKMAEWIKKENDKGSKIGIESEKLKAAIAKVSKPQIEEASLESEPALELVEMKAVAEMAPDVDPTVAVELEETKPVIESEATNEASNSQEALAHQYVSYKGPLASIGEDGRVEDTPEVREAKEAHFLAYKQVAKITKVNEERKKEDSKEDLKWYEARNKIFSPPAPSNWYYTVDVPVEFRRSNAPIFEYEEHVNSTRKTKRGKVKRRKAHEYSRSIPKRH